MMLAVLGGAGMALPAVAVTPLTTTVTATQAQFTTSLQTATVVGLNASNTVIGASPGTTVNVARFNTNTGILVGARAAVNTSVITTAQVGGNSIGAGSRTVTANVTQTGSVSVAGVTFNSAAQTVSRTCSGGNCANSPGNNTATSTSATISGTTAVATANLAALAGTGTIGFTNAATGSTQVTTAGSAANGTAQSFMTFGSTTAANNSYSIAYDYVNFANPSFNTSSTVRTTSVNFGTRFIDSGTASQTVTLTNIGNINSADLAVNSVTRATNNGNFTTTLGPVTSLAANSSQNFAVGLNPTTVGAHTESFTLNAADYAPGGVGIRPYTLTVNATSTLINHASPSFNGSTIETSRTLNFGMVSSRGGPVLQSFSLFNLGDLNSAGLELYQINGPGDARLSANVSPFLNLAGGGFNDYNVTLNPLNLGVVNGIYSFLFRDYAPSVSGGRNYTLTLNIVGTVFDPVPEPASWMTMLLGFGLVGAVARRRTVRQPG